MSASPRRSGNPRLLYLFSFLLFPFYFITARLIIVFLDSYASGFAQSITNESDVNLSVKPMICFSGTPILSLLPALPDHFDQNLQIDLFFPATFFFTTFTPSATSHWNSSMEFTGASEYVMSYLSIE